MRHTGELVEGGIPIMTGRCEMCGSYTNVVQYVASCRPDTVAWSICTACTLSLDMHIRAYRHTRDARKRQEVAQ